MNKIIKKMFFIALLALVFQNFCLLANAKIVKFIQITDVHFKSKNEIPLKETIKEINKNHKNIDFVVFTGDNIDSADGKDYYNFLRIIKKLHKKPYIIIGNHDLSEAKSMTCENYMFLTRKILGRYHSQNPNYTIKKGNIVFLSMNGVKEYFASSSGYFKKDELDWIDCNLKKYSNKKVVILQHFPLVDTKYENANLWKKEDYLKVLSKHKNVIAIVSGHYHENAEFSKNGIYNIITPDFKKTNCYKIIEIDDETGMITTSLINK